MGDYRLAVLNAANEGFQSKMNADVGSYVIHGFWKRATALLKEKGEVPRLGKIFKEIQEDLGAYKQFPDFRWNNDTANVVLKRRKKADVKKVVAVGGVEVEGVEVELADIVLQSSDVKVIEKDTAVGSAGGDLVFGDKEVPDLEMVPTNSAGAGYKLTGAESPMAM